MQKVTLTKIYTTNKDKNGNDLKSKTGKPYTRMSIKANEYGDKWISGFKNKDNANWKEGDVVDVIIEEKNGYLNFNVPKKEEQNNLVLQKILLHLSGIKLNQERIMEHLKISQTQSNQNIPYPEEEINVDDIPF